jgi:two-component system, chemotaxis family, chemotaxis protein CheY
LTPLRMTPANTSLLAADTLRPGEAAPSRFDASPVAEEASERHFTYGTKHGCGSAPKQILVIDDDPDVLRLVAITMTRAGFQADTARNGEEGWTALGLTTYDLVITDHEMPMLTGLKLIERLRAVSTEPPCILISANLPGTESALRSIVHRGEVLAKPFSPSQLIEKVYGLLLHGEYQES